MEKEYKVILIGDTNVGKTALAIRFCENNFSPTSATVGLDYCSKRVTIDGEPIMLHLWDTAGQEQFWLALAPSYYRDVDAIVIVYDMTDVRTFKSLHFWLNECTLHDIDINKIPRVLVGNKCDCLAEVAVTQEMGNRFARQNKLPFYETSAKDENEYDTVNNIFLDLARQILKQDPKIKKQDTIKVKALPPPKKKFKCCIII